MLARIGRDWGLFRPGDMLDWNEAEGRPSWITGLGMVFYYPILALAIGGIVVLRRRRTRQWPLLIPPVIVTVGTVPPTARPASGYRPSRASWCSPRWRSRAVGPMVAGAGAPRAGPEPDQTPESSTIVASSSS